MRKIFVILFTACLCLESFAQDVNLALRKSYTLSPRPNYSYTTDEADAQQLTDGQTTEKHFWTQKGTVGWTNASYVEITVDLGAVEPIGRLEMTTAAGSGWVDWPFAVTLLVSDDGETYRIVDNLVEDELEQGGPWPQGYAIRCLRSRELNVRGRFARLVGIPTNTYFFTDEIRVFRGNEDCLTKEPTGEQVSKETSKAIGRIREIACSNIRLRLDVAEAAKMIDDSSLSAEKKRFLTNQLRPLHTTRAPIPDDFRTVFPMNDSQRKIYEIVAQFWKEMGCSDVSVSFANRWDPIERFCVPKDQPTAKLDVFVMRNETRGAAFNVYSVTGNPVQLTIDGVDEYADVEVYRVLWTDSNFCSAVASALVPAERQSDGSFWIPTIPGLAGQIYLKFKTKPGNFSDVKTISGTVVCAGISIPLTLTVYPFDFPQKTTLLAGGYDYLHKPEGSYAITAENRAAFLQYAKSVGQNAPWAYSDVINDFTVGPGGEITLNTEKFDYWLSLYPDARAYFIYISQEWRNSRWSGTWRDCKLGLPEFEKLVANWIHAWEQYWLSKGIQPNQIYILIADEPSADMETTALVHWGRALNKASSQIRVTEDPLFMRPDKIPPELVDVCDVLQPNRSAWMDHRDTFNAFYLPLKSKGKELQVYACIGPVKTQDPYSYILTQAWHVAQIGGTGSSFWAWADTSGGSDWNEYPLTRSCFSLLFYDKNGVTISKHAEAFGEGVRDFEYIQILKTRKPELIPTLNRKLEEILSAENASKRLWNVPKDRTLTEKARREFLEFLVQ